MASCESVRPWLQAHVDAEQTPLSSEVIDAHLAECAACRRDADGLRRFTQGLRQVHQQATASPGLQQRVWDATRPRTARRVRLGAAIAALAALLGVVSALGWQDAGSDPSRRLVAVAVEQHEQTLAGAALEFQSADRSELTRWAAARLAFPITLPRLDNPDLTLVGARLVLAGNQTAAYFAYRRVDAWVSLAVVPAAEEHHPEDAGVEQFGRLKFHFRDLRGHHVITWTDHDLTYALVSELPAQGRESCGVCHAPGSSPSSVEGFHRL